jgi:hypothetical protein
MLFSSGEVNVFELSVARTGTVEGFRVRSARTSDDIEVVGLEDGGS